jgi:ubiquitin carboxyl-terminal hydrolase 5/13
VKLQDDQTRSRRSFARHTVSAEGPLCAEESETLRDSQLDSRSVIMVDEGTLERIRAELSKIRVPTSYSKIYKDECMFSFATPESEGGLYVNLNTWHGVGSRFLAMDHERSGGVLYLNERHKRVPLQDEEMTNGSSAPTKMKLGGDDGFQVDKKNYTIEKTAALVLMPDNTRIELPCPELPELVLRTIAAIEVSALRGGCHWRLRLQ